MSIPLAPVSSLEASYLPYQAYSNDVKRHKPESQKEEGPGWLASIFIAILIILLVVETLSLVKLWINARNDPAYQDNAGLRYSIQLQIQYIGATFLITSFAVFITVLFR